MPGVTTSVDIDALPEAVWALMSDPPRYPDFVTVTERMLAVPEGEFGLGSKYREYGGIPPFKSESDWEVTGFEPYTRQVHVGDDGTATITLTLDLEPTAEGTRLTYRVDLKPRWFMAPLSAILWPLVMRRRAQREMDATAANSKRLLESAQ